MMVMIKIPNYQIILLYVLLYTVQIIRSGGVASLGEYNVNIDLTSVSGISSGGYMAVQMNVAYSSIMIGAGVFAAGPYHCAHGSLLAAQQNCMYGKPPPEITPLISTTNARAQSGDIDSTLNLENQRIYIFSGTLDSTVEPPVVETLYQYYDHYMGSGSSSQILFDNSLPAAHTQPTNFPVANPCSISASPFISECEYDGAGFALSHIFNYTLNPPSGELHGDIIEFSQSEFYNGIGSINSIGLDNTGYVYVPKNCQLGSFCYLHISFHGCFQEYDTIGDDYINWAGYNQWADTNNIIVLYPQIKASLVNPINPNGCWDWWGYTGIFNYDTQSGAQITVIKKMIDRITAGYVNELIPPANLHVISVNESSITIGWANGGGNQNIAGYFIYRNNILITSSPIPTFTYTDINLLSGTTYEYTVVAVSEGGAQGAPSTKLTVITEGPPPPLSPPTSLQANEITSKSAEIMWDYVEGASSYNVYRSSELVENTENNYFFDLSLSPSTTYEYFVNAQNAAGNSNNSSSIFITTDSQFQCKTYTDNNFNHVQRGRAYAKLGFVYASGSDNYMGLYNIFVYSTISETYPYYYEVGFC